MLSTLSGTHPQNQWHTITHTQLHVPVDTPTHELTLAHHKALKSANQVIIASMQTARTTQPPSLADAMSLEQQAPVVPPTAAPEPATSLCPVSVGDLQQRLQVKALRTRHIFMWERGSLSFFRHVKETKAWTFLKEWMGIKAPHYSIIQKPVFLAALKAAMYLARRQKQTQATEQVHHSMDSNDDGTKDEGTKDDGTKDDGTKVGGAGGATPGGGHTHPPLMAGSRGRRG